MGPWIVSTGAFFCVKIQKPKEVSHGNSSGKKFYGSTEFSFKESAPTIRAMMDRNGDPWFVATDVADILNFRDASNAAQTLKNDEKGTYKVSTLRGDQEVIIINLSGLYRLIFRSNKPEAELFRQWVFNEVLPALHRVGMYGVPLNMEVPEAPEEALALWVYLDKQQESLQSRLRSIRDLKKSAMARVKQSAQPYHIPLGKQIGLFSGVES